MSETLQFVPEACSYQPPYVAILTLEPQRVPESIFTTYDITNEVDFLARHRHLPLGRRKHYVEQNLLKFAGEFAAEVSYQNIPGVLTLDGKLEIAGFDVGAMAAETAELNAAGHRERAEFQGIQKVAQLMQKGMRKGAEPENIRVMWISPPKSPETNYGLGFYFQVGCYDEQLQGYQVTEKILRYDEKFGNLQQSKRVYTELQSKAGQPWSAHHLNSSADFLLEPILFYGDAALDREIMEDVFNIESDDIHFTREFERRVLGELQPLIHGYVALALEIADGKTQPTKGQTKELEETLERIFYWSKEIDKRMQERGQIPYNEKYVDIYDSRAETQFRQAHASGEIMLMSGTNCAIVKGSIYTFAESQTTLCCTCPLCQKSRPWKQQNSQNSSEQPASQLLLQFPLGQQTDQAMEQYMNPVRAA